jgi:hypothetical protein
MNIISLKATSLISSRDVIRMDSNIPSHAALTRYTILAFESIKLSLEKSQQCLRVLHFRFVLLYLTYATV